MYRQIVTIGAIILMVLTQTFLANGSILTETSKGDVRFILRDHTTAFRFLNCVTNIERNCKPIGNGLASINIILLLITGLIFFICS